MSKGIDNQTAPKWAGMLAMALGAAILLSPAAYANTLRRGSSAGSAGNSYGGTFLSGYYDLDPGVSGDNVLRLENPTADNGNLCAMIYVFNAGEAMGECCGCRLTPNQLLSGSVKALLGNGWTLAGGTPTHGVLQIISATPNNGTLCSPNRPYTATMELDGWITHEQTVAGVTGLTEVSLTDNGTADSFESQSLIGNCGALLGNGSGAGNCICPKSEEFFAP